MGISPVDKFSVLQDKVSWQGSVLLTLICCWGLAGGARMVGVCPPIFSLFSFLPPGPVRPEIKTMIFSEQLDLGQEEGETTTWWTVSRSELCKWGMFLFNDHMSWPMVWISDGNQSSSNLGRIVWEEFAVVNWGFVELLCGGYEITNKMSRPGSS